jgi:hypothetical protein
MWATAVLVSEDSTMNTIITTKDGHLVDAAVPLREYAVRVALAYLAAFMLAFLDHVERLTGRRDHDNYTGLVRPDDPVLQELWRADATTKRVRELVADTEVMDQLARLPGLVAIAEDCAERLLATL